MAEHLTKIILTLSKEVKAELQTIEKIIATLPIAEMKKMIAETTNNMEDRMKGLEDSYSELKQIILDRSTQHFNTDPTLLEQWNPRVMVLKHSPWTNMRLVLNKVAADIIADLFPTDWHPRPPITNVQEKYFKVLTKTMTEMFLQCGLLNEADTIEMNNYQSFLQVLHHHVVMGNVSTTQLTHFILLMVYMSFCRLKHYTEHNEERNTVMLKTTIWMSLVIVSFRTAFSMKGGHNTINPYFKNIPSVVRRHIHAVITRYMDQVCVPAKIIYKIISVLQL